MSGTLCRTSLARVSAGLLSFVLKNDEVGIVSYKSKILVEKLKE